MGATNEPTADWVRRTVAECEAEYPEAHYRRVIAELHDRALRAEAERDRARILMRLLASAVQGTNERRGLSIARALLPDVWKELGEEDA